MVVWNTNPKGTKPIFICAKYSVDSKGGPAVGEITYSISPGQGIDLSILGLKQKRKKRETNPNH